MAASESNVPRLVVVSPVEREGLVFDLSGQEMVIGHSDTADIVVEDPYLSRRHALLTISSDEVSVHDLNSTGGTFVNEERLTDPRVLRPGDLVRFADIVTRFEPSRSPDIAGSPQAAPPTVPMAVGAYAPQTADTETATTASESSDDRSLQAQDAPAEAAAPPDDSPASPAESTGPQPSADQAPTVSPGPSSEYESLTTFLDALYPGRAGASPEDAGRAEDSDRSGETAWAAHAVALGTLADLFSQIAVPAPASTEATPAQAPSAQEATLRPELYYALFRAAVPANANALNQIAPAMVRAIWRQACRQAVIPQSLAADLTSAEANFQAISAARAFGAFPPAGIPALREMLPAIITDEAQQEQLTQLQAEHEGDWAGFWAAVEQALGAVPANQLQVLSQLLHLAAGDRALVAALMAAENSALGSIRDLAARGYHDPAKWTPLIGSAVPPGIPGADIEEQSGNYAQFLAAQVRIAVPTAVLADQIRRGILPITDNPDVARGVADFLTSNQGQFEIGIESAGSYAARTGLTGVPAEVMRQVERLQRAYRLNSDHAGLAVLLRHDLDSAFAITRYSPEGFAVVFARELGGAARATAIHAWATQVLALERLPRPSPALLRARR
jgi:FHA domain